MDDEVARELNEIRTRFDELMEAIRQASISERTSSEAASVKLAALDRGVAAMRQEQARTSQGVAAMRQEQARTSQEVGKMNDKIDNLENDLQKALQKTIRTELRDIRDAIQDREKLEA